MGGSVNGDGDRRRVTSFAKSHKFASQIHELIPGGAHTYSKGGDQFPAEAPAAITRGEGARVWDLDGNQYIDWSMGLTSVSLGHGYRPVVDAVCEEICKGTNFPRPSPIELKAAQTFLEIVGSGEMVKFAKNGSTVTTAALKLARAFTGRAYVAIPEDAPFLSYDDWFIGTTPANLGVPESAGAYTLRFRYDDIESLHRLFRAMPGQIACVMLEPVRFAPPREGFLHEVKDLCRREGAVFVLDEMITGMKWDLGGAQRYLGVEPDLATWGKGIANGFSACVLSGRAEIMELGGIRRVGQPKLFLISTTHGAETGPLAAMIATLREHRDKAIILDNWRRGTELRARLLEEIRLAGLGDFLRLDGYPCLLAVDARDHAGKPCLGYKTLLMQELIANGVLFAGIFYTTWSHQAPEIDATVSAFRRACDVYCRAIEAGSYRSFLVGEPIQPVFRKLV